jgi:sporulation protein YlmC with PRC-barrel domain
MSSKLAIVAVIAATVTGPAFAQEATTSPKTTGAATTQVPATTQILTALPQNVTTIANYYKQSVYDPSDSKIGEISDVLLNKEGKIDAFMIGVGGFLGIGAEKDVAVPFDAVRVTEKNGKTYLTMNTTKDALKSAHGYKYDRSTSTWSPV